MRVLFFISGLSNKSGGPSRSVPLLVRGLAEIGVEMTLMTYRSKDMNVHLLSDTSAVVKLLDGSDGYRSIESYIANGRFDLIQLQSIWDLSYHWVARAARKHGIPYIITPRGMLEPWSLSQKRLKKLVALALYQKRDLKIASCIFTTAEMEAKNVKALHITKPCAIIPNGLDPNAYPCRNNPTVVKKQILFLSRIHKKKGIELLIEVWKRINVDYEGWCIRIVGNGDESYISYLKDIIEHYGLTDSITIEPPVFGESKIELYQESSVFVLPSYSENFGMVIAEALSCGVPVITTDNTPWQFLNEMRIGWCIPLTLTELETALREAIDRDPLELYKMGQDGSRLVAERFGYYAISKKTIELYRWILNGGVKPDYVI